MMIRALAAALLAAVSSPAFASGHYTVTDQGMFASTGRTVEFADRFGWASYETKFDFSLDSDGRSLSSNSSLSVTIRRNEGGSWTYRCKARDPREMWANVNSIYGRGMLIVAECRVKAGKFASSVGLDEDMVGEPTLVVSAWLRDGKAEAGNQKGFYFLSAGQIQSSVMNQYATENDDPSELAVLFATSDIPTGQPMPAYRYYYQPVPRFVP